MVVLKLGGSLLALRDLPGRIEAVLKQRPDRQIVVVVGGGAAVDQVRDRDRIHALGDEAAHQLALQAMRRNAEFVARSLPAANIVTDRHGLTAAWTSGQVPLVDAAAWLSAAERSGCKTVPHTWQATSDSIAGWLATDLHATELVLLKSVPRPVGNMQQASADGLVDLCFPDAVARVPQISWVNLRSDECRIEAWLSN